MSKDWLYLIEKRIRLDWVGVICEDCGVVGGRFGKVRESGDWCWVLRGCYMIGKAKAGGMLCSFDVHQCWTRTVTIYEFT